MPLRIGFIGNFEAPYSTENDRRKAFQLLGHNVLAIQENLIYPDTKLPTDLDLLVYSHTHGWEAQRGNPDCLLAYFKELSCPTITVHLDLWRKLDRENDIGREPSWKTDFVFTPDKELNYILPNHHYLTPGIAEDSCYLAAPDLTRFTYQVAFIGSENYHKEYPQRPQLVQFLRQRYKDKFLHVPDGLRGHDLNVLYRTVPIIVGDSCFSQTTPIPGYYSDRIPETLGRGGLLLHPPIDTNMPGLVEWHSLTELERQIAYYLDNPVEAERHRLLGHQFIKSNHTYTHKAQEILNAIGIS